MKEDILYYPKGVSDDNDFKKLIKLADSCFIADKKSGGMLERWPHCYSSIDNGISGHILFKQNNKLLSHVGCVPQTLIVGDKRLNMVSISGVATCPEARGRGLMTKLLNYAIAEMDNSDTHLSVLSGFRQRYNNFGYENAGRQIKFTILSGVIKTLKPENKRFKVFKYNGEGKLLSKIINVHNKEKLSVARTKYVYKLLMNRKGGEVLLSTDGRNWAYMVKAIFSTDDTYNVSEFGGDEKCILNIISNICKNKKIKEVIIGSSIEHKLNNLFFKISSGYWMESLGMVRIVDLKKTLMAFVPQINKKLKEYGLRPKVDVFLEIKHSKQGVCLSFHNGDVEVTDKQVKNKISISELEMVRFLFGILPPSYHFNVSGKLKFLDVIFPLDFYIWGNDKA